MSDPSLALQNAVEAALRASAALKSAMGLATVRLYTLSAPIGAPYPYVIIGEDQVIGDDTDCGPASDVAVPVHAWSRVEGDVAASRAQAKTMAAAIRAALTAQLTVAGHRVVDWSFETARHLTDPDGLTAHSVLTFEYYTAPSA